jgi:hypothetical protein
LVDVSVVVVADAPTVIGLGSRLRPLPFFFGSLARSVGERIDDGGGNAASAVPASVGWSKAGGKSSVNCLRS